MSEFGHQIIFKQLLDRHGRVEVPRIQRDYAQGRESFAEVRDEFLDALRGAIDLPAGDPKLPLNLDFIYGSVEGSVITRFSPLDGQQRLTTLFLLHWYTAWRDGCSEIFKTLLCTDGCSRFSYSVRPSSAEFFDTLINFEPACEPEQVAKLSSLIKNQSWYFRHWRLDPTIQSVLLMLDSIHDKFISAKGAYARLTNEDYPAITFQLLDLANFGLSDDLYIKMNARGKPLTPFETFKARFEQELESQFAGEFRTIGDERFSVSEYFSRRMDTVWADFFWAHRDSETNLYDEAVMNLFRAVIMITRDPEKKSYNKEIGDLKNSSLKSSFSLFHSRGWLDRAFSEGLILLLETWSGNGTILSTQLPNNLYFDEKVIFAKAAAKPSELGYSEIVQLVAYLSFLTEHKSNTDPNSFQEWMRVVFNLTINTSYDRALDMQRSVAGILAMLPRSATILNYFAEMEKPTSGFNSQQVQEEKLKAELILANKEWRSLIDRAESHGYFKGQIEFLLDFCGVLDQWKAGVSVDWTLENHQKFQDEFERNLSIAEIMFGALIPQKEYRWERALLSIGDYLLPSGKQNVSFLVSSQTEQGSWKRLLRGSSPYVLERRKLLQSLWERLSPDEEIGQQLDTIIASASGIELWRQCIIECPQAISYCGNRAIRWNSEVNIYLLSKTQMNGAHAELFTYCLYQQLLGEDLAPLDLMNYYTSIETAIEPGVRFDWDGDKNRYFELEWTRGKFKLYRILDIDVDPPSFVPYLVKMAGFKISSNQLFKMCEHSEIRDLIDTLRDALSKFKEPE